MGISGGYVSTDPRIPLYGASASGPQAQAESAAFNYAITTAETPDDPLPDLAPLGFTRLACYGNGSRGPPASGAGRHCTPGAAPPLTASLPDWLDMPKRPRAEGRTCASSPITPLSARWRTSAGQAGETVIARTLSDSVPHGTDREAVFVINGDAHTVMQLVLARRMLSGFDRPIVAIDLIFRGPPPSRAASPIW